MTTPRTRNERLLETEGAIAWPDRRSPAALHSRIQRFISVVAATRGDAYVTSWLSERTCDFSHAAIMTTSTGVDRLRHDFGRLAKSLSVSIVFDPRLEKRLRLENAALAAAKAKTSRGKG